MAKKYWWLKLEAHTWLNDPKLQRLSRANRDSWLTAILLMVVEGSADLSGPPGELQRLLHLSDVEFEDFVADLENTKTADVTRSHNSVTLTSRRRQREQNGRENGRLRQQRHRSAVNVTAASHPIVKSKKKKSEVKENEEAAANAAGVLKSASADVEEVFEAWKMILNHPRALLDKKRLRLIENGLKTYSVLELKTAIEGCKRSPYHQGANDTGTVYDSIGLIFRDAEKIEGFISKATQPKEVKNVRSRAYNDVSETTGETLKRIGVVQNSDNGSAM